MSTFRLAVPVLALVFAPRSESAFALSLPSDRMLITDPTGTVVISNTSIPDNPTLIGPPLTFGGGHIPRITDPGPSVLLLTSSNEKTPLASGLTGRALLQQDR